MRRLIVLLPLFALAVFGCGKAIDKQWYQPNRDYTAADLERDGAACTGKKSRVLDEACLKDKGWLPLSGDIGPAVKAPSTPPRSGGKY